MGNSNKLEPQLESKTDCLLNVNEDLAYCKLEELFFHEYYALPGQFHFRGLVIRDIKMMSIENYHTEVFLEEFFDLFGERMEPFTVSFDFRYSLIKVNPYSGIIKCWADIVKFIREEISSKDECDKNEEEKNEMKFLEKHFCIFNRIMKDYERLIEEGYRYYEHTIESNIEKSFFASALFYESKVDLDRWKELVKIYESGFIKPIVQTKI